MRLSTSRYQSTGLIEQSGALAVGITRYPPRWKLSYPVSHLRLLAPDATLLKALRAGEIDEDEFEARYTTSLNHLGIAHVRRELEAITAGRDAVLLCFEDVHKGQRCHRRVLARWLEEQTGHVVPEIGVTPP